MVTVGAILRETWAVVRANPAAIAVWSIVQLILGLLMRWGMEPFYQAQAANALARVQGLPVAFPPLGRFFLMWLVMMVAMIALYNAAFRAVLFPEDRKAAFLRLGMDELRLLGLVVVLMVAMFVLAIGLGVLISVIGIALGAVLGVSKAAGGLIALLVMLVLWGGMIFLGVRLSLAAPLTLVRRKIMIGPAWKLTRGHFWTLLGAFLVVAIVVILISILMLLPTMGPMLDAMAHPGDPAAQQRFAELQAQQMRLSLNPFTILQLVMTALFGGVMLAYFGGMPAVATRLLLQEQEAPAVGSHEGPWGQVNRSE